MADPFRRSLIRVASLLTPAHWQALSRGERLTFSTAREPGALPLPHALARSLREAKAWPLPPGTQQRFLTPEEVASYHEEARQIHAGWEQAAGLRVSLRLHLPDRAGATQAILQIKPRALMPEDAVAPRPALPFLVIAAGPDADPRATRPDAEDTAWAADPLLGRKARFSVVPEPASKGGRDGAPVGSGEPAAAESRPEEIGTLNYLLPLIAEAYQINLVADAYRTEEWSLSAFPTGEEWVLYRLLQRVVQREAGCRREGEFLLVRRHTWYLDRLAEVPDRVVRHWANYLRRAGRFTLEDAARLVLTLRDEQLTPFESRMSEAGVGVSVPFDEEEAEGARQRAILRAFGNLLPGQRQALVAGGRVAVGAMPLEARRWLQAALASDRTAEGTASHVGAAAPPPRLSAVGLLSLGRAPLLGMDDEEERPVPVPGALLGDDHRVVFRYHSPGGEPKEFTVWLPQVE
jgi:hypothetical protein